MKTGKLKISLFGVMVLALSLITAGISLSACASVTPPTSSASASASLTAGASLPPSPAPVHAVSPSASPSPTPKPSASPGPTGVVYKNTQYGFDFDLPDDWAGYTIVTEQWKGTPVGGSTAPEQTGPEILIRSPKWTKQTPTQDIPIMVFTIDEWNAVLRGELAVSAAPIPPSELGQNSKYIFALPARYNYAFLPGWEEVDKLIQSKPLHGTENFI